ncbi:hypothetical protein [Pseudonocardia sp. HH130630-07]|uniref:hypothetical protein n=1 Tax=Pseudonocardia sp. HH130630-07 TaxID=1690815 RepID=UPI000814BDCF|nr:hypothetical protein [Pseudonocardia sp. HH130630-07]ANY06769.1 hypothetical protein AFB00_11250 [Pseudonocardia sp. HH130630-07]
MLVVAAGPVPMPSDVAARIRTRLAAGAAPGRPAIPRRTRRTTVLLAAAAVVGLVAIPVLNGPGTGPEPVTGAVDGDRAAAGTGRIRACLASAGIDDPGAPVLDTRPHPGPDGPDLLVVLGTSAPGRERTVVVPPGCRPGSARVLGGTGTG